MTISRWILLRMRNVSDKSCKENQNTFYVQSLFFRESCRVWDNVKKSDGAREATADNIIRRIRFACWISKATRTRTEICNIYCFCTASWTRPNLTLCIHCQYCCSWLREERVVLSSMTAIVTYCIPYAANCGLDSLMSCIVPTLVVITIYSFASHGHRCRRWAATSHQPFSPLCRRLRDFEG